MAISEERRSEIFLSNIGLTDCGVIAIQAVTGWPRKRALKFAIEKCQYDETSGTPHGAIDSALRAAGYRVEPVEHYVSSTAATFALTHEYGKFLVYVSGHVMGLVDGDLYNSRSHWGKQLVRAAKVEKE